MTPQLQKSDTPYRILLPISAGGMGTVCKAEARYTSGTRVCALKFMHPHLARDPELVARFEREALIGIRATGTHPNLVPIRHFGVWPTGEPFVEMDFISGATLHDIRDEVRDDFTRIRGIVVDVLAALSHLASEAIIHRDLSPGNILVNDKGVAMLTDYGLAKEAGAAHSGHIMGSLPYMSPEVLRGEPATVASDLYSLGAILYELLTGAPPYGIDDSVSQLLSKIEANVRLQSLSLPEHTPPDLARLVFALLQSEPDKRGTPERAQALLAQPNEEATKTPQQRHGIRPGPWLLGILAIAIAVAVVAWTRLGTEQRSDCEQPALCLQSAFADYE